MGVSYERGSSVNPETQTLSPEIVHPKPPKPKQKLLPPQPESQTSEPAPRTLTPHPQLLNINPFKPHPTIQTQIAVAETGIFCSEKGFGGSRNNPPPGVPVDHGDCREDGDPTFHSVLVIEVYDSHHDRSEMARREGMDVRPTIAVTKAHIQVNTPAPERRPNA